MEANKATRRGGRYCVAGTPQKVSCKNTSYTPGIKMHAFPKDPKTRQKWVQFVRKHRLDFKELTKHSLLCSAHFEDSCYSRRFSDESSGYRVLEHGSIPTRDTSFLLENEDDKDDGITARGKRKVCFVKFNYIIFTKHAVVFAYCISMKWLINIYFINHYHIFHASFHNTRFSLICFV